MKNLLAKLLSALLIATLTLPCVSFSEENTGGGYLS